MRPSIFISALLAAIVGFGSSLALTLAAADALGATQAQTVSWVTGLGLSIAVNATLLSVVFKMPITTAWSTPGASLLAGTAGLGMDQAVAAFLICAVLLILTALIRPLRTLVENLPLPLANALLAGVLFGFIVRVFPAINAEPWLALPMIGVFFVLRLFSPIWATLAALIFGLAVAYALGLTAPLPSFGLPQLVFITPQWDWATVFALAIPLYLVTMAGQNLPGIAALRVAGYSPDIRPILAQTGLSSLALAFVGTQTQNLSAITATIVTSPDAHPDKGKRWLVGPTLGAVYLCMALSAGWIVAFFTGLPSALIFTLAAVGLSGPLMTALSASFAEPKLAFPALMTFLVAQSGLVFLGLGAAFWGFLIGLGLWGLSSWRQRLG